MCAGIMDDPVAHDERLQTRPRQAIQQLQARRTDRPARQADSLPPSDDALA